MINFGRLEEAAGQLAEAYKKANPFPIVIIDEFCDTEKLCQVLRDIPDPKSAGIKRSRDYVFAKNKFEKSSFRDISPALSELHTDLSSDRFRQLVSEIVDTDILVDPAFHGGGIHQGGEGSFLDMHVDFTHHPENLLWKRELNILLYLNRDWEERYGGCLKLKNRNTGDFATVEPLFNRCVIMKTADFTLHGYDKISFPSDTYRRSIAAYAYSHVSEPVPARSTVWYPDQGPRLKTLLGEMWPKLVKIKGRVFGSATSRNK